MRQLMKLSTENLSLRIHKVCHSNLYKAILRRIFRFIFTPSIYYAENGNFC